MANGIEHRSVDSVLEAFRAYDKPNFTIWAGKQLRVKYEGGNWDEAMQELLNYLNVIMAANTQCVYTLRVYGEETTGIQSKTAYEGSTTFMFSPVQTTQQNGVTVIDRGGTTAVSGTRTDPAVTRELEELRKKTDQLQADLQKKELEILKQDFTNQVAGLKRQYEEQPELSFGDKAMAFLEKLIEKPEIVEKTIGALRNAFTGGNNYIIPNSPAASQVAGTNHEEQMETATTHFVNPFLQPEELKLRKKEKNELMKQRLEPLSEELHEDLQNECLDSIQQRIGQVTLSRMLIAVAEMDDDDLNKLLNHLD